MSRADFERWMTDDYKCVVRSTDPYPAGIERDMWKCWQAATSTRVAELEAEVARYKAREQKEFDRATDALHRNLNP